MYSYSCLPESVTAWTRLTKREPSLWNRPRSNGPECRSTIACCQSSKAIFLLCFLPGPCCGNTQGQCFHCIFIALQPLRAVRWTEPLGFTRRIDCSISSMRPGYALSVSTWSTYTPRGGVPTIRRRGTTQAGARMPPRLGDRDRHTVGRAATGYMERVVIRVFDRRVASAEWY